MSALRPNLGPSLSFSIGVYIHSNYTKYSLVLVARAREGRCGMSGENVEKVYRWRRRSETPAGGREEAILDTPEKNLTFLQSPVKMRVRTLFRALFCLPEI